MAAATRRGRLSIAAIAALCLSAAVAACGGGGDAQRSSAASTSERPAAGSTPSRAATIDMADLRFEPRKVTVARGTTVTFRNVGEVTHNAKGKTFFSRVVEAGDSYRHRFDEAGTFAYVCTFHPGMEGSLTVR